MRIAVLNSWPNLEYSAEREFIARLKLACLNLGWVCIEAVTSDEVLEANPDCVMVTHEYSPKLTEIPTIGLMWNPPVFFREDPLRMRSILSYDGYLAGSDSVREYLGDLLFSTAKNSPVSDWNFLPTAPQTEFRPPDLSNPSLFYAGVHWDGDRHGKLIKGLRASLPMVFYGDPAKWARFGAAYKGKIPFDGTTIFDRINEAGVALCLHRNEHLKYEVPSMRLFEAAAAGAVIITESSNFARRNFGDSVLYVDQDAKVASKVDQIRMHFEWICAHPAEAAVLAAKSNALFNENFSLEKLLARLPEFLQKVRSAGCFELDNPNNDSPKVEAVVRVGGRSLPFIERCLDSLARQSHANLGVILVCYREVPGLATLLEKYKARFTSIRRLASEPTGFRSTSLWDGIRAVEGQYFCNLDDDDTLHPNHISSLVALLESDMGCHVAYSGCVQIHDEPGHYFHQANFNGTAGVQIKESRHLLLFDRFHRQRILRADNIVASNSFLARKSVLNEKDLVDPKLAVAEDIYLYCLFLRRGDFQFSWSATANWHWRATSGDNSAKKETNWEQCVDRVRLRTKYFALSGSGNDELTYKVIWLFLEAYVRGKSPYVYSLLKRLREWRKKWM